MSAEDRLRTALHAAADDTPVDPASYDRIERRTVAARRRRRGVGGGLAAVALVAVAVTVPLALRDDGGEPVQTGPASDTRDTTTTTSSTTTTEPESTPTEPAVDEPLFRWPSDGTGYDSTGDLVTAFAEEYLGVVRPAVEDNGDSTFTVRPRGEGGAPAPAEGPRTVVEVGPFGGSTVVIGAVSPNIRVDLPAAGTAITSPVRVSGQARNLFEGTVIVEVRTEAGDAPVVTVPGIAAGSGPELADFSVEVPFGGLPAGRGGIVVKSDSGLEGTPEATVVPLTFGSPPATDTTEVRVYLLDQRGDYVPVTRQVPRTTGVLRASLEQLLAGATPEEQARGLTSPFDDDAALLRGVTITPDGTAVVDLERGFGTAIPNSSTSAMSAAILASLDHTVFQFPSVVRVSYRFGGECGTFGEIDPDFLCEPRTRDEY